MTFIMGARCTDGVVLVADKKVTSADYSEFEYQNKLFDGIGHIIYGSSGSTSLYQLFVDNVMNYVTTHPNEMTYRNAVLKLSEIAFDIYRRYNFNPEYYYNLLVAVSPPNEPSRLTFITGSGMPRTISKCHSIGNGSKYASVFLKMCYDQDMNMVQAAELGYFVIRYIENLQLDMTVGINDGYPQIWFVPDGEYSNLTHKKIDYEITPDNPETQERFNTIQENADRRFRSHQKHIKELFNN